MASTVSAPWIALRRIGRPRVGLLTGLVIAGSLAAAVAVGLARTLPVWRARWAVKEGARLVHEGDYTSAVRALLGAVAVRPSDAHAHYSLGLAYARLGASAGALNQLAEAVRLAPGDPRMHDGLGQAYRETGDALSALREFEEATRLGPQEPTYLVHLAGLLLDQGSGPAAVERLRQAAQLRPRSADIHLLLATALRRGGDPRGVAGEYREVSRLAGDGPLGEIAKLELQERSTR